MADAQQAMDLGDFKRGGAEFSVCGRYRYTLWRRWKATGPGATFCMLNPSSADADDDDPTVTRCVGFATLWGCSSVLVINPSALISTSPLGLLESSDPIGPVNQDVLDSAMVNSSGLDEPFVVGWGTHRSPKLRRYIADRGEAIRDGARTLGVTLQCLGKNQDGSPKHPLYLATTTQLEAWP